MSEQRLIDANELLIRLRGNVLIDVTPEIEYEIENAPTIDPKKNGYVLRSVLDQFRWERDIAIDQLHSYGVEFGEKAEMQRVRHGKWIKTFRYMGKNLNTGEVIPVNSYDCSECGYHTGNQGRKFNYCPNCGAKMDKE